MAMDRLIERLRTGVGPGLRVAELAAVVGCSRSYIYKLIDAKTITPGKVGADYRISLTEAARVAREAGVRLND